LTYEERRFECLIQNISGKGMFLICKDDVKVGWVLGLQFEMEPGIEFSARIEVRHVDYGCFGAEIIELSLKSSAVLQHFLDFQFAEQSRLPERRVRR